MKNENGQKELRQQYDFKAVKLMVILTVAIAMTACMVACGANGYLPSAPDHNQDDQSQQTNQDGTPNTGNSETPTESESQQSDEGQYSAILQYVLTDDYYNNVLNSVINYNINNKSPLLDPHPYAFLEDMGHDVNSIKNGQLKCRSQAFVKENEPNTLYMYTYVETKGSTPYYTEYMLKYELTEKEMADYNMMHENNYIQAVFMNDAVSEFKTPTIISQANCTVESHSKLHSEIKSTFANILHGSKVMTMILKDFNKESSELSVFAISYRQNDNKHYIAEIPLKTYIQIKTATDNSYYAPSEWNNLNFRISEDNISAETVTMYWSQDYDLLSTSLFEHNQ